jgi:hypothetical protein
MLIVDVESGSTDYSVVLVYDVKADVAVQQPDEILTKPTGRARRTSLFLPNSPNRALARDFNNRNCVSVSAISEQSLSCPSSLSERTVLLRDMLLAMIDEQICEHCRISLDRLCKNKPPNVGSSAIVTRHR